MNGFFLDSLNHGAESWVDTVLKNINIYAGALKPETIYDLAHDPEVCFHAKATELCTELNTEQSALLGHGKIRCALLRSR